MIYFNEYFLKYYVEYYFRRFCKIFVNFSTFSYKLDKISTKLLWILSGNFVNISSKLLQNFLNIFTKLFLFPLFQKKKPFLNHLTFLASTSNIVVKCFLRQLKIIHIISIKFFETFSKIIQHIGTPNYIESFTNTFKHFLHISLILLRMFYLTSENYFLSIPKFFQKIRKFKKSLAQQVRQKSDISWRTVRSLQLILRLHHGRRIIVHPIWDHLTPKINITFFYHKLDVKFFYSTIFSK